MIFSLYYLMIVKITYIKEAIANASVLGSSILLVFEITSYARVTRAQKAARTPFSTPLFDRNSRESPYDAWGA